MNIFPTGFYASLSNILDDNDQRPNYYTYDYSAISRYVDHYAREDFLKSMIIPVHIRDHWLLCIIDPPQKTIYIIDSLEIRNKHTNVFNNIRLWYQTVLIEHQYDILHHNSSTWTIIDSSNLPSSVPCQRDGSSCGIFVAMTAYYWYQYKILPEASSYGKKETEPESKPSLKSMPRGLLRNFRRICTVLVLSRKVDN